MFEIQNRNVKLLFMEFNKEFLVNIKYPLKNLAFEQRFNFVMKSSLNKIVQTFHV